MGGNQKLTRAKVAKNDEFYTPYEAVEAELSHYTRHFRDKVVYSNCDDPHWSNFVKYFARNFNSLGLRELIATCYGQRRVQTTLDGAVVPSSRPGIIPYEMHIREIPETDGDPADVGHLLRSDANTLRVLDGDGDFRSAECRRILDTADIVVTNPPFSLFREFVPLILGRGKDLIALGNINAGLYQYTFPYFMNGRLHADNARSISYVTPQGVKSMGSTCWYATPESDAPHVPINLTRRYDPAVHPRIDNYDAINVDHAADIPCDYDGTMAVPISILLVHDPSQFEILGATEACITPPTKNYGVMDAVYPDGRTNCRTMTHTPMLRVDDIPTDRPYYMKGDECYVALYKRVLIRNRHPSSPASECPDGASEAAVCAPDSTVTQISQYAGVRL